MGLVVEPDVRSGESRRWLADVVGQLEGTREDALRELEARARAFPPPRWAQRTRLLRTAEGFLLVVNGSWADGHHRFSVAEVLHDSAAPPPEAPRDSAVPPPGAVPDVPRDADGVARTPSWLGRTDLP
ncbi:hypothetical protein BLA24_30325 [Streptomyces cinnamoneus]|uniref:Uncharacterized protein n=1 Tax=Streptomyces cinnamoneus TaxID=53446 RepID=A0A2G1X9B1_STRCJ|nr:hypothetical protein [Streptomyces cinnamoneus]PHQ47811.1 hypothetical protein BLA24_30325 [Streptomyces cinnamoneus]PPT15436.1 hypothetical protein CYQ11_23420 [Streptomyces cinnamoneus]